MVQILILFIFIVVIAYLHYLKCIFGENPFILILDAFLAGILNCFIIGYISDFIKYVQKKENTLPSLNMKYIQIVFKNKFLLMIFLFSAMPFIFVDDVIKNNMIMHFLYIINLAIFVPLSVMIVGFSLKNNLFYYFKYFKLIDYIKNTIYFSIVFLLFLIPILYVLYNFKNLVFLTIILTINVFIIHLFIFLWFFYITKSLLKKEKNCG